MCPPVTLRKRPHHLLHPTRRRIRTHVLPIIPNRQTAGVGGSRRGESQGFEGGVHGKSQGAFQTAQYGQQCGDLCARSR